VSFELTQLVIRGRIGRGARASEASRKLLLIVLADAAHDDGGGIFMSVATMAARAGCSRRSVEYALAELEREGLIHRDGRRKCRGGAVTVWRIDVARCSGLSVTPSRNTVTPSRNGSPLHCAPRADLPPHHVRTYPRTTCTQKKSMKIIS